MAGKTRYDRILEARTERPTQQERAFALRTAARHKRAETAWAEIHSAFDEMDLPHRLFGSLPRGDFGAHSDIDIPVPGNPSAATRASAERVAARAARYHDVPVDLVFARWFVDGDNIGLED